MAIMRGRNGVMAPLLQDLQDHVYALQIVLGSAPCCNSRGQLHSDKSMHASHSFKHAAAELRRTSWRELAGYAFLALFTMILARLAAPAAMDSVLRKGGLILPLILLAAKDLAHTPDALRRLRTASGWRCRIAALLPPELVGMLRLDRLMWIGFAHWLRRRAPERRPEGVALNYLQRGAYGTFVGIVMVSLFLELPINVMIVNLIFKDPGTRMIVDAVATVSALYSFVWMLSDRWHVGEGSHVLADEVLHLRVGVRSQASIPLAAIERFETVAHDPIQWRRQHGIHRANTLLVTPFDKPNCVLVLKPDAAVTILHWQVRRAAPRYLLLYLDRPELLASRVKLVAA